MLRQAKQAYRLWQDAIRADMEAGRDPIGDHFDRIGRALLPAVVGMAAVLAALLLYAGSAAARPAPTPPPEGWGAAELQIAAGYWGVPTPPLCETTAAIWDVTTLPPDLAGRATMPDEAGTDCHMEIAPASTAGGLYWQCVVVVHEYGHWMGLGHSADTSSPMAAQLNGTIFVRGCALLAGVRRSTVTKITHKRFRLR